MEPDQTFIHHRPTLGSLGTVLVLLSGVALGTGPARAAGPDQGSAVQATREVTLEQCLLEATQNNRRRPASRFAVAAAEAQHRQALAGYWPQVGLKGGYLRLGNSPDFLFPASNMQLPAGSATITVPAGVLGPNPVQLPVSTPAQSISIPAQDVKLMNPDNLQVSLNATWLLYDGGMRQGLREQTDGLVEVMRQDARRTDLEIGDSVTRLYYGAVLARQVSQLGQDTLSRMEATLTLTETLYKAGGGKVLKTDWLDAKVMADTLRSVVASLEKNDAMAQAALANTMGLPWSSSVRPADKDIPFAPFAGSLDELVDRALRLSPDWNKVEAGLRAAEGAVRVASSEYLPRVAATGEVHGWWNSYDAGMATSQNREGWSVGVGVEFPIFSGFLTRNKVDEAQARLSKLQEERLLLKEGLGLQLKDAVLGLRATGASCQATQAALEAAIENRELNMRAYQSELVATEKVIRAQLQEALMAAQHYKARFDHVATLSQIRLLVGAEVERGLPSRDAVPSR